MLRDFKDRRTCDGRLLALVLAATAASFACGSNDNNANTADVAFAPTPMGPAANGLTFPMGVQDWLPIGAAARADDGTLRVIVGNETAVKAARAGNTNPWPEGSMLSHLVWDAEKNPVDAATIGPGAFGAVTLMVKDSSKYSKDGNWAYGVWMGDNLLPPSATDFDRACVDCHTSRVADRDFVFTEPGELPELGTMAAAPAAGSGVAFPSKILDWHVIGIADVLGDTPSLRVIVGNPTAVTAARSGNTNPWPDGSMISHYNWKAGANAAAGPDTVAPGAFNAFTLMQRSSANYAAKGNWAYGAWTTSALNALADDKGCVDCHTAQVSNRDMVFTAVSQFPDMLLTPPPAAALAR